MARVALTVQMVESAKPQASAYRLHDTKVPGLSLRVLPSGVKSWNVTWARNRDLAIGKYPTVTLESARTRARRKLAEADEHGAPLALLKSKPKDLTWGVYLADHYKPHVLATAKAGAATVANLEAQFAHLDDTPLTGISRAEFDAFKAARLKAKIKPATVNRDLDRIKAALQQAVNWELLAVNPLAGVKRIKRDIEQRIRYLTKDEEKALRKALAARETLAATRRESGDAWRVERGYEPMGPIVGYSDHLMPITLLALNTGLRRGEITQLKWADIDLAGRRLTVRAGYAKSGKARHVPLNSEALQVLTDYRKQHTGKGELFGIASVKTAWAGLMREAKITGFRFHDLRHSFASKLVTRGIDLNTVRELLGHGDIAMTLRYAHLAPEHKAAAVEALID
ncbi:site-specific integrase [Pseudoxanthomonas indica]|uniref:Site-specific recombinase XerD n=1 Tax=Pseudoxanthomonas indica TaxID=428993 RepID=A0A1T5LX05_9GAMM|nr:site-specific integrase [Pseudoxanthomonas indica]GGD40632.1 integrase [Pseudoxanthomonas indica]SKC80119.1 Site-specific recombinase XerD [Pseudoxanthomonas indica]